MGGMTKRELIAALAPYSDDQYVYVNLHSDRYPNGSQVIIQDVKAFPPWHEGPPDLIGLVAHENNRDMRPDPIEAFGQAIVNAAFLRMMRDFGMPDHGSFAVDAATVVDAIHPAAKVLP